MRKCQQEKIIDLLETLKEALDELSKQSDKKVIVGLLADCQDFVIQIGNYIEDIEGRGCNTVMMLENFCELLFRASTGEVGVGVLRKNLDKILNSVKSELPPNKIEIAFLSYKASMSDSILSIYEAAKADPACDAFWIPIPYFELSLEEGDPCMRYEGQEHYPNVECTDWRAYDIEQRHPDIVFTFNPYDNNNRVTSVHPNFYCKRLHKLTELLVYVPYFLIDNTIHEGLVSKAGCVFAHKVILQSENARKAYIEAFKKIYGYKFGNPEDKFVAIGSPKFDALINTKVEECKLPDEWERLIKKPDGSRKKIVLYNTRLTDISAGIEKQLAKLKRSLAGFKKQDSFLLWWRPHPLNMECLKSMCPQFTQQYAQIVDEYKDGGWGIYDDSDELHRAVVISDAYYGDMSSLIFFFLFMGKPRLFQNVDFYGEIDFEYLSRNQAKGVWELDLYNGTFQYDLEWLGQQLSERREQIAKDGDGNAGQKIYEYSKSITLI